MKISEYKKGIRVRVSNDISATTKNYLSNNIMDRMRGKIFILENIHYSKQGGILKSKTGGSYVFDFIDLKIIKMTPPIEPVMFNPENILNEG